MGESKMLILKRAWYLLFAVCSGFASQYSIALGQSNSDFARECLFVQGNGRIFTNECAIPLIVTEMTIRDNRSGQTIVLGADDIHLGLAQRPDLASSVQQHEAVEVLSSYDFNPKLLQTGLGTNLILIPSYFQGHAISSRSAGIVSINGAVPAQ